VAGSSAAAQTETRVGDYEVLVGGSAVAFWPLDPAVDISKAKPAIVAAPVSGSATNSVVVPVVGIFDFLIETTDGVVTNMVAPPNLLSSPAGKATIKKMPLLRHPNGTIWVRFAVDHSKVPAGGFWEGVLQLTGKAMVGTAAPTSSKTQLTLKVARQGIVKDVYVFFVAHSRPKKNAWVKSAVQSSAGAKLSGVKVDLKVLRDNGAFSGVNRRVALFGVDGELHGGANRPVLAVPVAWPLIFTLTSSGHVTRAHMINVKDAEAARDNLSPLDVGPMRLTPTTTAKLTGRKFVLDAGHGVIYALTKARRCQEWYVAHRLADKIAQILQSEHGVKAADISFSRSAGFGLIEPTQVHSGGAPETGDKKFQVDLPKMKIAIKQASLGLHDLAALLLTNHQGAADAAVPISAADHAAFLTRNQSTIDAIIKRLNGTLAATKHRVSPGSVHWDETTKRYVYTKDKQDATGTWLAESGKPTPFPITTTDWFALDKPALDILANRSARWSLTAEIGGDATFRSAARKVMLADGALDYFKAKVLYYLNVTAPHPYLNSGPKAWGPTDRVKYLNSAGAAADMVLTLHENAGGGKGGMVLVSHKGGADAPPADQVRIGKTFLKYLDAFDVGVRQGGVAKDLAANPAQMLYQGTTIRDKYAYFESEFMDGKDPADPTKYTYETMVAGDFVQKVARQIVCGIVEWLLDPQAGLDPVKWPLGSNIGGLW
jgi:hypothetical protein